MAMMEDDDLKKYSDLYYLLMYELPKLPDTKPKVWAAFSRYSGEFAAISIMWGVTPLIKVDTSLMMDCVDDGDPVAQKDGSFVQKRKIGWYGFTVPTKGIEEIYVAKDLALGAGSTQVGAILEATLLHELVHWCRKVGGKNVYDEDAPSAFEREAYGKVMLRTWQSCMSLEYFKVSSR